MPETLSTPDTMISESTEISPLFDPADQGLEAIEDSLLRGEDETPEKKETPEEEEKKETPEEEEKKETPDKKEISDKDKPSDEKEDEIDVALREAAEEVAKASKEEPKKVTPPKGFVPTEALHEAREESKFLKGQIADFQEQIQALTGSIQELKSSVNKGPEVDPLAEFKDFKVLSRAEFKDLVEDNPTEGLIYMDNLQAYKDAKAAAETLKKPAEENTDNDAGVEIIFKEANGLMEEYIPGIFDESKPVATELAEFAKSIGFKSDLFYLTDPSTKVIMPGAKEPVFLGTHAAEILNTLAKAKALQADEATLRKSITKELSTKILSKLKKDPQAFVSLTTISDADTEHTQSRFSGKVLSGAEYEKLSEAEKQAYLSGD